MVCDWRRVLLNALVVHLSCTSITMVNGVQCGLFFRSSAKHFG